MFASHYSSYFKFRNGSVKMETIEQGTGRLLLDRNITCLHHLSDDQTAFITSLYWWLEAVGSLSIGTGGIFLNLIAISILSSNELRTSFFHWLLVCLEIFDSCFLVCCVLEGFRKHIGLVNTPTHNLIFAKFLFPFRSVVLLCSTYVTISLGIERYNALINPVSHRKSTSLIILQNQFAIYRWRLLKYIGPIIMFTSCFYIPRYFEIKATIKEDEYVPNNDTGDSITQYVLEPTEMRKSKAYILWYINIANLIVTCAIPLLSIIFLNGKVYYELGRYMQRRPSIVPADSASNPSASHTRQTPQNREKLQQTVTLFGIMIAFCVCHSLRVILNIKELSTFDLSASLSGCNPWSITFMVLVPISETFLQINCSVNFYIYCALNNRFREVFIIKFTSFVQWISSSKQSRSAMTISEKRITSNNEDNTFPNKS